MLAAVKTFPEGYVVVAYPSDKERVAIGADYVPQKDLKMKCFGWCQSAAREFARYLNSNRCDNLLTIAKMSIATYDPEVKYSYPEFSETGKLKRIPKQ